jgi:protein-S-isoprenylcysteine O-methyltransferase Ste14
MASLIVKRLLSFSAQWLLANAIFVLALVGGSKPLGDPRLVALMVVLNILWLVPVIGSVYVSEAKIRTTDKGYCYHLWMGAMLVELVVVGADYAHLRGATRITRLETDLGLALVILGFLVSAVAWLSIQRYSAPQFQIIEGHKVVDEGLYRRVRHPIYLGFFLIGVGLPIFVRSVLGLVVFAVIVTPTWLYVIGQEEKFLLAELGDDYAQYMRRTKRLIPLVY